MLSRPSNATTKPARETQFQRWLACEEMTHCHQLHIASPASRQRLIPNSMPALIHQAALWSWRPGVKQTQALILCGCRDVQEGLELSSEQERGVLRARQDLVERLQVVAAERKAILSTVALLVLQRRPVRMPNCRPGSEICVSSCLA